MKVEVMVNKVHTGYVLLASHTTEVVFPFMAHVVPLARTSPCL